MLGNSRELSYVYLGSPSELPRDPAYFSFTVGTSNPITAPFLQQDDLTAWTSDGIAFRYQTLEKDHSGLGWSLISFTNV